MDNPNEPFLPIPDDQFHYTMKPEQMPYNCTFRFDDVAEAMRRYSMTGNFSESCMGLPFTAGTFSVWSRKHVNFMEACGEALDVYRARLQAAARMRAVEGWDEPVFQNGHLVGHKRKFDSALLIRKLERWCPEYRKDVQDEAQDTSKVLISPPLAQSEAEFLRQAEDEKGNR